MTRNRHLGWLLTVAAAGLILTVGCTTTATDAKPAAHDRGPAAQPVEKIKITRLDDLPQHTYPFTGNVVTLLTTRDDVKALAARVRADVESDLAHYEIEDPTTLKRMYNALIAIDLLEQKYDAALAGLVRVQALEGKEAARLTTGLSTRALIAARREVGDDASEPVLKQAFQRYLTAAVEKLPWDVVQDEIQQAKGRMEIISPAFLVGAVGGRLQPSIDQNGELDAEMAQGIIGAHITLTERLPFKDEMIAVYQAYIDAHKQAKPDIWAARSVDLSPSDQGSPVLICVWDSGTDAALFADRLWMNSNELPNGKDDDNNGYVDDLHGIAYDVNAEKATELLCPLGDAADRIPKVMDYMKGLMDLQASIDSTEAQALKKFLSELPSEKVRSFLEDLGLAGNYAHGTHVAGLMMAGNPFARLMIARLSYDHRTIPVPRTPEWGQRDAAKCRDTVNYFKQHGVRVVNMSWGEAQADAEDSLEKNGVGDSAEQRREMARETFGYQKEALYNAIKNAPDILFVCAAGNADNDVEFDDQIASGFDLPNLLVVGAVDQAGEPTGFTSFGRTVQVYANGFEVDSLVPGGQHMKMSGTSMASPNAANLAAKLLALNPSLTPVEVVKLMKEGADQRTQGEHTFLLMNPQRSIDLLRQRMTQ